jgi:hypothetical protein
LLKVRLCSGDEKALPSLTLDPPSWEGEVKLMQSNYCTTSAGRGDPDQAKDGVNGLFAVGSYND